MFSNLQFITIFGDFLLPNQVDLSAYCFYRFSTSNVCVLRCNNTFLVVICLDYRFVQWDLVGSVFLKAQTVRDFCSNLQPEKLDPCNIQMSFMCFLVTSSIKLLLLTQYLNIKIHFHFHS